MIFRWSTHKKTLAIEFFEFLDRKMKRVLKTFNGEPIDMNTYCVCVWIKTSLALLKGEAWYEADGRHARRKRNFWKKYTQDGGTAPVELTKAEMTKAAKGSELFLSGSYGALD